MFLWIFLLLWFFSKNKVCSKCKSEKPLSEFYPQEGHKGRVMSMCKECFNVNIVTLDSMIQIMLSLTSTIQTPILRSIVGPNSDYSLIQRLEKNYLNVSCYVLTVIDLSTLIANSDSSQTRTGTQLLRRQLLYPLS